MWKSGLNNSKRFYHSDYKTRQHSGSSFGLIRAGGAYQPSISWSQKSAQSYSRALIFGRVTIQPRMVGLKAPREPSFYRKGFNRFRHYFVPVCRDYHFGMKLAQFVEQLEIDTVRQGIQTQAKPILFTHHCFASKLFISSLSLCFFVCGSEGRFE